jgi:hypothetical protein
LDAILPLRADIMSGLKDVPDGLGDFFHIMQGFSLGYAFEDILTEQAFAIEGLFKPFVYIKQFFSVHHVFDVGQRKLGFDSA